MYGFTGTDVRNLAAVYLPSSAFENSAQYNVLDDPATIRAGLDGLPGDQSFHPYVLATTPGMTNSACRCAIVLPPDWYRQLAMHFPHGIELKAFYDRFLSTIPVAERQALETVFTWWRHAASRAASTSAPRSGLQVIMQQAVSPTTRSTRDAWAHEQATKMLQPLHQASPPLSNSSFKNAFALLRTNMANQHAAREA